jgi:hypothetical protein
MPNLLQLEQDFFKKVFLEDSCVQEEELLIKYGKKNVEILLKFWEFKGVVTTSVYNGIKVVKAGSDRVNAVEGGVLQVKNTLRKIENSLSKMEKSLSSIGESKLNLKKKLQLEICKLQNSRDNLNGILQEIYKLLLNKEIMNAMDVGNKTLNTVLLEIGNQDLDLIMEELQENLEKSREIDDVINQSMEEDMEEVEKELEQLVLQETLFPKVPSLNPKQEEIPKQQQGVERVAELL